LVPLGLPVLLATGCNSNQAITNPATQPAREINTLWWAMLAGAMVVFAVVVALLVIAFVRRGRPGEPSHDDRGPYKVIIGGGLAAPMVVLAILFGFVIHVMPATSAPPGPTKLTVDVIGHQWFWEVRYPGTPAVTANEIHIPSGTAVDVRVTTVDVIHSFWVPRLNRTIDAIPGRVNAIELNADTPARYRGQCDEFCGLQHAHMAFYVDADPPSVFRRWLAREAKPATAKPPHAFVAAGCDSCHAIRGTDASAHVGPDLTHVASRTTLAALAIPNDRQHMRDWIVDAQRIKPGAQMPSFELPPGQVDSIVSYLERLK